MTRHLVLVTLLFSTAWGCDRNDTPVDPLPRKPLDPTYEPTLDTIEDAVEPADSDEAALEPEVDEGLPRSPTEED